MCYGCWQEYLDDSDGSPASVTPHITDAVTAVSDLYEMHTTGGVMHVVTDDWNLDDDLVASIGRDDLEHADQRERACWERLSSLTVIQRATAMAIYDGFLAPDGTILVHDR